MAWIETVEPSMRFPTFISYGKCLIWDEDEKVRFRILVRFHLPTKQAMVEVLMMDREQGTWHQPIQWPTSLMPYLIRLVQKAEQSVVPLDSAFEKEAVQQVVFGAESSPFEPTLEDLQERVEAAFEVVGGFRSLFGELTASYWMSDSTTTRKLIRVSDPEWTEEGYRRAAGDPGDLTSQEHTWLTREEVIFRERLADQYSPEEITEAMLVLRNRRSAEEA
jgi:hypothetical protein